MGNNNFSFCKNIINRLQDGFRGGNVNVDPSTSDPSQIGVYKRNPSSRGGDQKINQQRKDSKGGIARTVLCTGICAAACASGAENSACMMCIIKHIKLQI